MWLAWSRCGQQDHHVHTQTAKPTGVAHEAWPQWTSRTDIGQWPPGHNGTARWPLRHNFSKVVLADHRQARRPRDHQMCVYKTSTCKDDLHGQNMRCGLQHQHI